MGPRHMREHREYEGHHRMGEGRLDMDPKTNTLFYLGNRETLVGTHRDERGEGSHLHGHFQLWCFWTGDHNWLWSQAEVPGSICQFALVTTPLWISQPHRYVKARPLGLDKPSQEQIGIHFFRQAKTPYNKFWRDS